MKESTKGISIVLTVHDQEEQLRQNLPLLLSQHYEPGYEVVVVDESSTDGTADVLKQLKAEYPHLYTTYLPSSSHYLSRRKMALTLAIKATRYEWVIVTEPDCMPESEDWLATLAEGLTDEVDAVCVYTPYIKGTQDHYAYLRMLTFWRQQRCPYRYDGACLAIRKSAFMSRNGFLQDLQYLRGEYDFLVNETDRDRIASLTMTSNRLLQDEPSDKTWTNRQLYYMNIRSRLRRAWLPRLLFAIWQAGLHLTYLLLVAAIVVTALRQQYILTAVASSLLLAVIALQILFGYRLCKTYGEHIALWKLPLLDLGVAWHYAGYGLRYLRANKSDFLRK